MQLKFKRDTSFRKQFFVPDSFAHPAKMDAQLLIWIVEHYTKVGDVILDPMAGMGTTMLACGLGRNVILLELEDKFVRMCLHNWQMVKMQPRLGYSMGNCILLYGDARQPYNAFPHTYSKLWLDYPKLDIQSIKSMRRKFGLALLPVTRWSDVKNLEGLLADVVISSPPYADIERRDRSKEDWWDEERERKFAGGSAKIAKGYQADAIITSPPYRERYAYKDPTVAQANDPYASIRDRIHRPYSQDPKNIGNLPYGSIDSIVTSPPFSEAKFDKRHGLKDLTTKGMKGRKSWANREDNNPTNPNNLGNLPYGNIDAVITSPPYEGIDVSQTHMTSKDRANPNNPNYRPSWKRKIEREGYLESARGPELADNIGNLKARSYLEAMLAVYQQCHKVLKPEGLMILVTKNFIRNKKIILLDMDTIRLCEQAGFQLIDRHQRKLPSQSFWRIIYHQKHPEVEQIKFEDVLVFKKYGD